mmetsp:Transcript_42034/g.88290  ORF Transcript_42034/g.88290 Transcript_42034/m.88290 type:complete len:190 (+) Transcript_42034:650-1219(+)
MDPLRRMRHVPSNNSEENENGTPRGQAPRPWWGTSRLGDTAELTQTNNGRCRHVATSGSVYASLMTTCGASAPLDNLRDDLPDAPFIDRIDLDMTEDIVDVDVGFLSNVLAVRTISLPSPARLLPTSSSAATVVVTVSNIGLPPAWLPSMSFHKEIHRRPCRVDTTDTTANPSRLRQFIPDQGTKNIRV